MRSLYSQHWTQLILLYTSKPHCLLELQIALSWSFKGMKFHNLLRLYFYTWWVKIVKKKNSGNTLHCVVYNVIYICINCIIFDGFHEVNLIPDHQIKKILLFIFYVNFMWKKKIFPDTETKAIPNIYFILKYLRERIKKCRSSTLL